MPRDQENQAEYADTDIAHHTAEITALEERSATGTRLFDVRTVIGGLFVLYGALLSAAGVFADTGALRKAQGININLWTGLAMLVVGLLFLLWLKLRPLAPPSGSPKARE